MLLFLQYSSIKYIQLKTVHKKLNKTKEKTGILNDHSFIIVLFLQYF